MPMKIVGLLWMYLRNRSYTDRSFTVHTSTRTISRWQRMLHADGLFKCEF